MIPNARHPRRSVLSLLIGRQSTRFGDARVILIGISRATLGWSWRDFIEEKHSMGRKESGVNGRRVRRCEVRRYRSCASGIWTEVELYMEDRGPNSERNLSLDMAV
jgi:hypothetical protein